eukprot:jgi/Tetstr1/448769/TSEL_036004.t1
MASAGPEPWTLRLRGPKGTPAALELPQGGATTLAQLVALAGKATRVAAARLVLRAGFPPRELWPAAAAGAVTADSTVQAVGLVNRDALHIDRRTGADAEAEVATTSSPAASPAAPAASPGKRKATPAPQPATPAALRTTARPKPKPKRRRVRMPGTGQRLGDGSEPAAAADEDGTQGATLGSAATAMDAAEASLAADLVGAVAGGDGTATSVHRSLRRSLREARKAMGAEAEALEKVAAALAGRVEFRDLADGTGRMEAAYKVGNRGVVKRELVNGIPPVLLPAILNLVASDTDPVSRKNLRVEAMAIVSPRMFWAVVRHGAVGPGRPFMDALASLAPQIDWEAIEARDRQRPERYADYVSH